MRKNPGPGAGWGAGLSAGRSLAPPACPYCSKSVSGGVSGPGEYTCSGCGGLVEARVDGGGELPKLNPLPANFADVSVRVQYLTSANLPKVRAWARRNGVTLNLEQYTRGAYSGKATVHSPWNVGKDETDRKVSALRQMLRDLHPGLNTNPGEDGLPKLNPGKTRKVKVGGREIEVEGSGATTYWRSLDPRDRSPWAGQFVLASPEFRAEIEAADKGNSNPSMPRADLFRRAAASNRAKAEEIRKRMAHKDIEARPPMQLFVDRLLREAAEYDVEAAKHEAPKE